MCERAPSRASRERMMNWSRARPFGPKCADSRVLTTAPRLYGARRMVSVPVRGKDSSIAQAGWRRPWTMCRRVRPLARASSLPPELDPSGNEPPGPVQFEPARLVMPGSSCFARSPAPEDFRSAFLVDLDHAGKTPLRTFLDPTVEGATVFELELGFAFLAEAEVCTEAFHWH